MSVTYSPRGEHSIVNRLQVLLRPPNSDEIFRGPALLCHDTLKDEKSHRSIEPNYPRLLRGGIQLGGRFSRCPCNQARPNDFAGVMMRTVIAGEAHLLAGRVTVRMVRYHVNHSAQCSIGINWRMGLQS